MNQLSKQQMAQEPLRLVEYTLDQLLTLFGGALNEDELASSYVAMMRAEANRGRSFEDIEWANALTNILAQVRALRV